MERYDYVAAVKDSIATWAKDNDVNIALLDDSGMEDLFDILWIDDSVTGNGSGSFTFSAWTAEEYLCHNLSLLKEACGEFDDSPDLDNPEGCDVTIRCWLLSRCLYELRDEIKEKDSTDK